MTFLDNKRPARSFFGSNRTFCIVVEGYCWKSRSIKACHNIALELNAASAKGADGQDRVTDDDVRPESPAFRRASSGNAVGDMRGVQFPRKRGGEQTHAVQRTIVSQMFCEAIAVVNGAHRTAARAGI